MTTKTKYGCTDPVNSVKPFTVRHILLECDDVSNVKNKYYHVNTIETMLNDVHIDNIFLFLKRD